MTRAKREEKKTWIAKGWKRLVVPELADTEIIESSITKFEYFRSRVGDRLAQVEEKDEDQGGMCTSTCPWPVQHLTENSPIPTYTKQRDVVDKYGKPVTSLRPCPYSLVPDWSVSTAGNRMTVYNDCAWDGHLRPVFTLFNIDKIPLKSQMDMYKKYEEKNKYVTTADWLGNDTEVQVVLGDLLGQVQRLDLQSRICLQWWVPFGGAAIKHIRCHYKYNLIAVMGASNHVSIYSTGNMEHTERHVPHHVASFSQDQPEIIEINWLKDKLVFMTSSEFGEFDIDAADLLKREKKYSAATKQMKAKVTYKPDNVSQSNPMRIFKTFQDDSVLVGFKRNRIEEHSYSKKRKLHSIDIPCYGKDADFALHPTKRVLAVAASDETVYIFDYKTGRQVQQPTKSASRVHKKAFCHWSSDRKDNLLVFCNNRVTRFCIKGDRLVTSRPTRCRAYYDQKDKIPWGLRYCCMDNTNVDHNHRDAQGKQNSDEAFAPDNPCRFVDLDQKKKRDRVIRIDAQLKASMEGMNINGAELEQKRENSDAGRKEVKRKKVDPDELEEEPL